MATIQFLDSAAPTDLAEWLARWQAWPGREVFAHPAYIRLFARPGDRVVCAAVSTASGGVLFPFVLRPVAIEPWAGKNEPACDLVTPYGYGGAFAWDCAEQESLMFRDRFHDWADANGVVASFARLSLFDAQQLPFDGDVVIDRPNIVRSLDITPEEIWHDYEHKVRKNVNCAKRAGLTAEIDPEGRRLDEFLAIYESTMDRRSADGGYYFPRKFFETLIRDLPGQFIFCHVLDRGRVVSTELVLVSAENIYSFLGGTLADAFSQRPNDLLKHEVILWGRQAGKLAYVLGGGYHGEDGIYRYKKSFAPNGKRPFCVGRRVHNTADYGRLVASRRQWEISQGNAWMPKPGYFPEYRA
jgi:hypothetical protein